MGAAAARDMSRISFLKKLRRRIMESRPPKLNSHFEGRVLRPLVAPIPETPSSSDSFLGGWVESSVQKIGQQLPLPNLKEVHTVATFQHASTVVAVYHSPMLWRGARYMGSFMR